ncbi:MAG: DUF1905 domain-containing protein [Xanthomonadales bacterium]|nr:DUF1905 domain-containing protein [Xanthomonadales bacterium]
MASDRQECFTATLLRPRSPEASRWLFVLLPKPISASLPTRGATSVVCALQGRELLTLALPDGQGGHWLKFSEDLVESARLTAGGRVELKVQPSATEAEAEIPQALRNALAENPAAQSLWSAITPAARRDWIMWINSAKRAETRAKRVQDTCQMLAGGKRRVCCFDRSGIYSKAFAAPTPAD